MQLLSYHIAVLLNKNVDQPNLAKSVTVGVKQTNGYLTLKYCKVEIITTKLWDSNYSDYQQYLFNRICEYKENKLIPIGYRKISQINEEGLKTPRGCVFKNNHVHSIYKKGIREERINREGIVKQKRLLKVIT